jgi:hypothetical protein
LTVVLKYIIDCDTYVLFLQGAELVVLKGATETLKKVTFVQLEVSLKLLFYTQHYEIIIREKEYI